MSYEDLNKNDHRRLGQDLNLFHFQEEAPGMVFWHPKGFKIFSILKNQLQEEMEKQGYLEINTPAIMNKELWINSGHFDKFNSSMIKTDDADFILKPMNCPGHVQIYNNELHSYAELPIRYCEFGNVFRNEPSGSLHGLMRLRSFTQDDGHVFCTEDQLENEIIELVRLVKKIYSWFSFDNLKIKVSTRPEKRIGEDYIWDKAEQSLMTALSKCELSYEINEGEGAFYGPKIEFTLIDSMSREWQCGTIQLDYSMPNKLGCSYVDSNGEKKIPILIHRAILGSLERFIGVMLEHFNGNLPIKYLSIQVIILPVSDIRHLEYSLKIKEFLISRNIRAIIDLSKETMSKKVKKSVLDKIPYSIIIGDKEVELGSITIRLKNGEQSTLSDYKQLADFNF